MSHTLGAATTRSGLGLANQALGTGASAAGSIVTPVQQGARHALRMQATKPAAPTFQSYIPQRQVSMALSEAGSHWCTRCSGGRKRRQPELSSAPINLRKNATVAKYVMYAGASFSDASKKSSSRHYAAAIPVQTVGSPGASIWRKSVTARRRILFGESRAKKNHRHPHLACAIAVQLSQRQTPMCRQFFLPQPENRKLPLVIALKATRYSPHLVHYQLCKTQASARDSSSRH